MDKEGWINRFFKPQPDPIVLISGNSNSHISIDKLILCVESQSGVSNPVQTAWEIDPAMKEMRIPQEQLLIQDPEKRACFLLEQLDKFHRTTTRFHLQPVIRNLALYSGFCTLWEKSNTSDLAQMEMQEKDTLVKLVKAGCIVWVIVNLDVCKALSCGFTKEEVVTRVSDLCALCDELSDYRNFEIVVDTNITTYEPFLILDRALLNFNSNFGNRSSYLFSQWISEPWSIESAISEFDERFIKCRNENVKFIRAFGRKLGIQKVSDLIFFYCQQKLSKMDTYEVML